MILALVLATIDQLPAPEELLSTPVILTPLAFRHFPGLEYEVCRENCRQNTEVFPVPSLLEFMIHYISSAPDGSARSRRSRSALESRPSLLESLQQNVPYYLQSIDVVKPSRARGKKTTGSRRIFLTSATLIVVPGNLVAQWVSEIHKHISAEEIRVLVVNDQDNFPPLMSMVSDYDVCALQRLVGNSTHCPFR
jgi:hypothetical protein